MEEKWKRKIDWFKSFFLSVFAVSGTKFQIDRPTTTTININCLLWQNFFFQVFRFSRLFSSIQTEFYNFTFFWKKNFFSLFIFIFLTNQKINNKTKNFKQTNRKVTSLVSEKKEKENFTLYGKGFFFVRVLCVLPK